MSDKATVSMEFLVNVDSLLSCLVHRHSSTLEKIGEYKEVDKLADQARDFYTKNKEQEMKIKMWCLINTKKKVPIKIGVGDIYVIGFATKNDLLAALRVDKEVNIEPHEEIKRIAVDE